MTAVIHIYSYLGGFVRFCHTYIQVSKNAKKMSIEKNTKVILKSFSERKSPKAETHPENNYWKLIGENGTVIDEIKNDSGRILILFDNDLDHFGVANHNPIKNSFWIKIEDLEIA